MQMDWAFSSCQPRTDVEIPLCVLNHGTFSQSCQDQWLHFMFITVSRDFLSFENADGLGF